jgi:hypothetical protein
MFALIIVVCIASVTALGHNAKPSCQVCTDP